MGEISYPDTANLEVEETGGRQVQTTSIVYSRRDRSLRVKTLTENVIEKLREHTQSEKVFSRLQPGSTCGDSTEMPDRAEAPQAAAFCVEDSSALSLGVTESPDAPGTPAASFTEDRGASLGSATASSEIGDRFLAGTDASPNEFECYSCKSFVPTSPMIPCSQKGCNWSYHKSCAKKLPGCSWRRSGNLICPQHVCHACGGSRAGRLWRCQRCPIASHEPCCPWPDEVTFSEDSPGWAICWRHVTDERKPHKLLTSAVSYLHKQRTSDPKEVFNRLPVLDVAEDFTISLEFLKEVMENDKEPPPYTHIRRNIFLIKKKRDDSDDGMTCSCGSEGSECGEGCDCRVQSMSCSKDCVCKNICTNKPYRKEKRLKVVKTEFCGWGAKAAEIVRKGEFIIEYIGEVIDDALCEKRLWAMKGRGINNFYMCEIGKDFIIDATFKGNPSRFLNHSCQPNCKLEKWRVDGETRVGVFALRDIPVGEPLTYDYRYVEFGANVKCQCGAPNCRVAIGESFHRTMMEGISKWGKKGRRSCTRSSKRASVFENQPWREMGKSLC
ncbi:unnamed protein product [Calypogeia fissa]